MSKPPTGQTLRQEEEKINSIIFFCIDSKNMYNVEGHTRRYCGNQNYSEHAERCVGCEVAALQTPATPVQDACETRAYRKTAMLRL